MSAAANFVGNYPFSQLGPSGLDLLEPIAAGGDPTVGAGFQRPIGWRVALPDGSAAWDKVGTAATAWTPIAAAGAFPGYGGAPPKVATASAAGGAATVSRSDHTHGLDLVTYTPSVAGMQAQGVLQQGFGAGTATPIVLTMTATLLPFGIAGGLLSQDTRFAYNTATGRFAISSTNAVDFANANNLGLLNIIRESSASGFIVLGVNNAAAGIGSFAWQHGRGTRAAPTIVLAGDFTSNYVLSPYDGANYLTTLSLASYVPPGAVPAAGNVPQIWTIQVFGGALLTGTLTQQTAFGVDTAWNVYTGAPTFNPAADSNGYLYIPGGAGTPVNLPANVFGSTIAQNRVATVYDTTHNLLWANLGGAMKAVPFGAFQAVGATAVTITNSPGASATVTEYLQINNTAGAVRYIPLLS